MRSVRVAAAADGAASVDEASSPPADSAGLAGAVTVLRARLRAVRESPAAAAVLGGGRKVGGWLKARVPERRKAHLQKLAKAADASSDNLVAEDAYLEALLKHR